MSFHILCLGELGKSELVMIKWSTVCVCVFIGTQESDDDDDASSTLVCTPLQHHYYTFGYIL